MKLVKIKDTYINLEAINAIRPTSDGVSIEFVLNNTSITLKDLYMTSVVNELRRYAQVFNDRSMYIYV